jgi:glycosyltransferase involved in cell wall biosynthesis
VPQNEACAAHLERFSFHAPVKFVGDVVEEPPAIAPDVVADLRRQLLRGRGTVLVGTVTRLEEARKGIPELLRALAQVAKNFPEAQFAIVGDGHDAPQYKQTVAEMGLADRVVFAGHQSNPYPYYKAFDIFVCPALVEGGPYTVLEAMQSGCAIVSTRVGQVPMWIESGRNGLIVEPGDSAALAAGMEQLLSDDARRKAMGENAARSIREKLLTPQQGAANLDDLFAETLQSFRPRPRKKR